MRASRGEDVHVRYSIQDACEDEVPQMLALEKRAAVRFVEFIQHGANFAYLAVPSDLTPWPRSGAGFEQQGLGTGPDRISRCAVERSVVPKASICGARTGICFLPICWPSGARKENVGRRTWLQEGPTSLDAPSDLGLRPCLPCLLAIPTGKTWSGLTA